MRFGKLHCLRACQYLEVADVYRAGKRLDTGSSVRIIQCMPEYKRRSFLSEEELQRIIHIEPRYKRQRAMRDMFLFMCFTGLSYVDLKAITYDNIHTDSDGGTWLMGNRIKTGVAYVVKLLPIAIELIEKYRVRMKRKTPECVFPVGEYNAMRLSLGIIGRKCNSGARSPAHRTPRICRSGHTQGDAAGNSSESVWA